jgi:hypothetical protein
LRKQVHYFRRRPPAIPVFVSLPAASLLFAEQLREIDVQRAPYRTALAPLHGW